MDQQEDIQDRSGFEQDMEHSAAVDYVRVNKLRPYSLPLVSVNYSIHTLKLHI